MDTVPVNSFIFLASIAVIAQGAVWLVDSASRIAARLGISELVIGLTVVAFGTSAPEVGVTVLAAIRDAGDISVGNVVGSNIINVSVILGGTALFGALRTPALVIKRDGPFLLGITALFIFFLFNQRLQLIESIILLVLFVAYLLYLFVKKEGLDEEVDTSPMRPYDPFLTILGLVMIVGGAHFMVESASFIARVYGVSEWIIGATIVAFGTSAPEIATSLIAAIRGHHAMSIGNLVGSNIFNLLLVLGIAGSIRELSVVPESITDIFIMTGIVVLVYIFAVSGRKVSRLEGAILLAVGIAHWVYSYSR
ncbi:calcium/sodium antiporter [candidate division GN15 bacterium]|nr:calcium/sodium antiporter [candidate division GN15 bacterium]